MQAALVDLVYVFETCDCPAADYAHLVEQLWHRDHLAELAGETARADLARREALVAETRRKALADAVNAIMAEARRGPAPARQHLTYGGGLRRAAKVLDPLLGAAMDAERGAVTSAWRPARPGETPGGLTPEFDSPQPAEVTTG